MTQEDCVVARDISKRFSGVVALDSVTLAVRPGEVHCLAGENGSGKSTLIKVISGVVAPDSGQILINGRSYSTLRVRQAIEHGIQVIYQDFSLFPNLTVAENIGLPDLVAHRRRLVRSAEVHRIAQSALEQIGVSLDLSARVENLSVAARQLTAIARALAQDARVIFMDEPTTALTWREVEALFGVVRSLKRRDVATVFVSHKLDEVMRISDRITILRNGIVAATGDVSGFDRASITRAMSGRDLADELQPTQFDASIDPRLVVEGLTLPGAFEAVSFSVRPGEVLGITGLLGSGRTEIAESVFGINRAAAGAIRVDGKLTRIRSVRDAMEAGIGYVPADRLLQGVFLEQSISQNVIASSLERLARRAGLLSGGAVRQMVRQAVSRLAIKASSPDAPARSLSGGNQQRVVLAKWLVRQPRVLILNSPTVGVDVGSKREILGIIRSLSSEGMAVVVISDDVPELLAVCHRVLVVRRGRITNNLSGSDLNQDSIMKELVA